MSRMFLQVSQLQVRYAGAPHPAVDGVSFGLAAGEIGVLIGPSGCGKTTLLRAVAGLERAQGGEIVLDILRMGNEVHLILSNPYRRDGQHHSGNKMALSNIRERLALPETAFSYLSSHGSLDIEHMQTYRRLMNTLQDPADQAAVIHASKVVYTLYTDMFRGLPRDGENLHAAA